MQVLASTTSYYNTKGQDQNCEHAGMTTLVVPFVQVYRNENAAWTRYNVAFDVGLGS